MKNFSRFRLLSIFVVMAYLLAACGGSLPKSVAPANGLKVEANVVAFRGVVESINNTEWTVNGQKITLDPQVSLAPNISVGDDVKVEAHVSADGTVVATKVESAKSDDPAATSSVDASSTPDPAGTSEVHATSDGPDKHSGGGQDSSSTQVAGASESEVFGTVENITANTITVNGVTYDLTNTAEIKDALAAGDQVKVHVVVNMDGTVTVREIEKTTASSNDNNSGSGNANSGSSHNDKSSGNSSSGNSSQDSSTHDSNDDHGGSGNGGSNNH